MSTLKQLINKFCPHGVESYVLGELERKNILKLGRGNVISKVEIKNTPGDFPVYSSSVIGDGEIGRYGKYMFDDERITWSIDGGGNFFYRNNLKYSVTNVGGWIKVLDNTILNTKYLYYSLSSSWKNQKYNYIKKAYPSVIRTEYDIPLPPLPVQEEIVKILDKFTDLENELENELRMRKMQFNAYRDKLLTFDNGVKFEKLYKLTSWDKKFNGVEKIKQKKIVPYKYILASEFEKIKQNSGNVKYIATGISGKDQYTTEELAGDYLFEGEIVCIPWGGTPNVKYHNGKFITSDNRIATSLNKDVLNNKFLYYYLNSKTKDIEKFYRGSGIKHPDMSKVLELTIPVPPLEKQKEIVEKLDKFNDMCNEISDGLPLEIELRKKQKKYILNKLLNI